MTDLFTPLAKNLNTRPLLLKLLLASLPILIISTVIISFNQITPQEKEAPQNSVNLGLDKVAILLAQPVPGLYPQKNQSSNQTLFNYNLYDGLTNLRSGKLEAGVAANWKNIDPNTWEFGIKKGIKFSNGQELKLSDIKYSLDEAVKNRWPIEEKLFQISSVKIIGDGIEIKTQSPLPDLPVYLKSVPIISPVQTQLLNGTTSYLGTGPYKLAKYETQEASGQIQQQTVEIELNQYYSKKPNTQKVVYQYLEPSKIKKLSDLELINTYQIIEAHGLNSETQNNLLSGAFSKTSIPQAKLGILFINVHPSTPDFPNQNNPFSEIKFRKALYQGLDISQIISRNNIAGKSATQPVGLFVFGYNSSFSRLNMNLSDSRKTLKENSYQNGMALTLNTDADLLPVAKTIAEQIKDIGINLKVVALNNAEVNRLLTSKDFTLYLGSWQNDFFSATSTLTSGFKSGAEKNYNNYSDPELDAKIKELEKTFDSQKRERLIQDTVNLAMASHSWLPLWEDTNIFLVNDGIDLTPSAPTILGVDISGK